MTLRRVLLVRHGRTAWNAEHRFQGQLDPPLDDVGRAQAYEVGGVLAALQPSVLVSSDLVRAQQTAQIIAGAVGLPIRTDGRLRERGLGHWEGLTRDEVEIRYPEEYADWTAGRDVSRRGGETRDEVAERALAAFADLPDADTAVLVTHGATAMALTNALLGIPQRVHPLGPLANCHWAELHSDVHGAEHRMWRLRGHNLGVPGTVVPLPVRGVDDPDAVTDADA